MLNVAVKIPEGLKVAESELTGLLYAVALHALNAGMRVGRAHPRMALDFSIPEEIRENYDKFAAAVKVSVSVPVRQVDVN